MISFSGRLAELALLVADGSVGERGRSAVRDFLVGAERLDLKLSRGEGSSRFADIIVTFIGRSHRAWTRPPALETIVPSASGPSGTSLQPAQMPATSGRMLPLVSR